MHTDSPLETITHDTAPNPTASVIWLHGLGADGSDFVPIVQELTLDGCAPIRFIFPHAPAIPVTINGGYVMRAWYDIRDSDLLAREDEVGLRASQQQINALIAQEIARGVPSSQIVLAGFSQGCAMTLQTGLRYPAPLGGLLCLSGYLPLHTTLAAERHPANQHTPIFMAHGTADSVVPCHRAEASRDVLTALGYHVAWRDYPMPHSVCPAEIADISTWLCQRFAKP